MDHLYSVKMRASRGGSHEAGGKHISGAERIVQATDAAEAARQLVMRAQQHERGRPDFINIKIEGLAGRSIRELTSLPVLTLHTKDHKEGLALAGKLLEMSGVKPAAARQGAQYLLEGAGPGGVNMRGAIVADVRTGTRLEPDRARGVRAAYMDYHPGVLEDLEQKLALYGLNNNHVKEALCLATKVSSVSSIVAELCWSDDPGYTTGYVAAAGFGYIRLPHMKEKGSERGGRVFFFDSRLGELQEAIDYLEGEPCLITCLGRINGPLSYGDFKKQFMEGCLKYVPPVKRAKGVRE